MSEVLDLHDSEVAKILALLEALHARAKAKKHNYLAFEAEIRDKFATIGFTVDVNWYEFAVNGQPQDGAMPEVTITGRTDKDFVFDKDRQVHEVTANILDIPGGGGVIKTDPDTLTRFLDGGGGHSHGHGPGR